MKSGFKLLLFLPLFGGCFSAAPPAPVKWPIDWVAPAETRLAPAGKGPAVKILSVDVRAPYQGTSLAVLRPDGSIAFDPCNHFAASPAALLRGPTEEIFQESALFQRVVGAGSVAVVPLMAEVTVAQWALDCRKEGACEATAAVIVSLVEKRAVRASARGEGRVCVVSGDLSAAFSKAYAEAVRAALRDLTPLL
jgi:hypothetical protein